MIKMSKNIGKAKKHLPSTTTVGGRMTTRSYARAVIEGVRQEKRAVMEGMLEEDRMLIDESEANRKLIEAVDKAEAEHENKKQKKRKKNSS